MLSPDEAQRENMDMGLYWKRVEEERRADYVRALLEERRGVEARDADPSRLADIDAELARVGHETATPAKRAETRAHKGATT